MNWRAITRGILIATAVVWIGWDIALGLRHQETESMVIADWVRQVNALALFFGALTAHWCMQNPNPHYERWPYAVAALVLALAWDGLTATWGVKGASVQLLHVPPWTRYPGIWFLLGVPVGFFFWPQKWPKLLG